MTDTLHLEIDVELSDIEQAMVADLDAAADDEGLSVREQVEKVAEAQLPPRVGQLLRAAHLRLEHGEAQAGQNAAKPGK